MSTAGNLAHPLGLSISLVCYKPDAGLLLCTLNSLRAAISHAETRLPLATQLTLVDNSGGPELLHGLLQQSGLVQSAQVISNATNLGFGKANNQVISTATSEFHLVLNPDVELQPDALYAAIEYLQQHPQAVAISPACRNGSGATEYLCKRYPSVFILLLRGFAPAWLKTFFQSELAHYEYQELAPFNDAAKAKLISGCFMLCRTQALQKAGGFDEAYFLYFEDFALSIELAKQGDIMYLPACQIVHHGGHAAKKGLQHIRYFLQSAWHFYRRYGWKLW